MFSISDSESVTIFAHLPTPRRTLISRTAASSKDCTSSVYFFGLRWAQLLIMYTDAPIRETIKVQELSCSQQHLLPFQRLHRDDLSYIQRKIQDTRDARQDPPTFQRTNLPSRPIDTTLPTRITSARDGRAEQSPVADNTDRDHHPFTAVGSTKRDHTLSYCYWRGDQGEKYHLQGWMLGVKTIKGYLTSGVRNRI